jgi:hypothetical protein
MPVVKQQEFYNIATYKYISLDWIFLTLEAISTEKIDIS